MVVGGGGGRGRWQRVEELLAAVSPSCLGVTGLPRTDHLRRHACAGCRPSQTHAHAATSTSLTCLYLHCLHVVRCELRKQKHIPNLNRSSPYHLQVHPPRRIAARPHTSLPSLPAGVIAELLGSDLARQASGITCLPWPPTSINSSTWASTVKKQRWV